MIKRGNVTIKLAFCGRKSTIYFSHFSVKKMLCIHLSREIRCHTTPAHIFKHSRPKYLTVILSNKIHNRNCHIVTSITFAFCEAIEHITLAKMCITSIQKSFMQLQYYNNSTIVQPRTTFNNFNRLSITLSHIFFRVTVPTS